MKPWHYITSYIYLNTYLQFKGNSGKVKLESYRLWTILEKGLWERLMVEVVTPSKVCFPLIYIFFEVMLMSEVDGIRSCFEDYILLFLFDVCIYVCIYVWPLLVEYSVIVIFHVIFFMCCVVIVNYFGKKIQSRENRG